MNGPYVQPCTCPDGQNVERCAPEDAQFWGLYDTQGMWVADFQTEELAEQALEEYENANPLA